MSTPPDLDLPEGVRAETITTARGSFAALVAEPTRVRRSVPALLVPGFTGSKEDFLAVLGPLLATGRQVIAIDQRGQHETPGHDDPASYAISELAADVHAVVDALDAGALHLLGHSFGGLVARAAAVAAPSRLRSLTLLGSGPAAVPHPSRSNLGLLLQALPSTDLATIWTIKRGMELADGQPPPSPAVEAFLRRRFLANSPTGLLRFAQQLLAEPDRVAELADRGLPLLVAHGDADDVWAPSEQADMARRLHARHAVVVGAAHSPAAEEPAQTARILADFWADTEREG